MVPAFSNCGLFKHFSGFSCFYDTWHSLIILTWAAHWGHMKYGTKVTVQQDAADGSGGGESHPVLVVRYLISCWDPWGKWEPIRVEESQKGDLHCGEGPNGQGLELLWSLKAKIIMLSNIYQELARNSYKHFSCVWSIFTATLWGKDCDHFHFIGEKTEGR